MKKTQVLSLTLALCMGCSIASAKCDFKQEKVQVYAHPSLMNADATEVKDANYVYRIGGKVLKQKNRLGFVNKDNVYVNAWSRDLLNAMSVRQGDRSFDIKVPISRSELAFMLSQGLNVKTAKTAKKYTDVSNSYWANQEIINATAADVMIGYPDKSFKPDQAITKAEVFATVAKLINVPYKKDGKAPTLKGNKIANIPTWAYGCTKEVIASGLIDNLPNPQDLYKSQYLTRHQVAVLIGELRLKYAASGQLNGDIFINLGAPVTFKIKMLDRVDAKHSNIGDVFVAKTTEAVTFAGETFPVGSQVYGKVVTVQRPGLKNPGSITVKFTEIKNGDIVRPFPKELSKATVDKKGNPNVVARVVGLPFTAAARTIGVSGRSAAGIVNTTANGLEEYGDRISDTFVETLTGHPGSGAKSFGMSFVTVGKGIYNIVKLTASGIFGIVYETGDEILYTIVPSVSNSAALNPNEELTVIF